MNTAYREGFLVHYLLQSYKVLCYVCCRKVQTLADEDDSGDQSASAWVQKMRLQEEERRLAEKRVFGLS